jgi:dihydropteroate synthase
LLFRVHDVAEHVAALKVFHAIRGAVIPAGNS